VRSLTGIAVVDAIELLALGALVTYATLGRSRAVYVSSALAYIAFFFPEPPLVTGMAAAGVVMVIVTDPRARRIAAYFLAACAGALLLAGALALTVRGDASAVRTRLSSVRHDLTADDPTLASRNLATTESELNHIQGRLTNPLTAPARVVPFAGKQLGAGRDLIAAVRAIVHTARGSVAGINPHDLKLQHGRVPVERIAALRQPALHVQAAARAAAARGRRTQRQFLVPPLNHLADDLVRQADSTRRSSGLIASLAADAPDLFGDHGLRRYFLLVQNPAEARASGGILAAYAEVTADHGQLALAAVGRDSTLNALSGDRPRQDVPGFARFHRLQPKRYWQNMTASPDFPTVAQEIEREYAPIAHPVDGVISIDPTALAAMLRVIGPVTVNDWPEPLTADNAVPVFEHDQYVRFAAVADYSKREAFMAGAVATIWSHLTGASDFSLNKGLDNLGAAVNDGHIAMHAVRSGEQSLFRRSGVTGAFPHGLRTDVLAVTSHNTGANKLDWFTTRTVTYAPHVDKRGKLTATLTIRFRNETPPGEPDYVAGPNDPRVARDHNPQFVSVYTPLRLTATTVNGAKPTVVDVDREFDMNVFGISVDLPPGVEQTIVMHLIGQVRRGAEYELVYRPQDLVHGDDPHVLSGGRRLRPLFTRTSGDSAAVRRYRFET
jgi:hypothetical protein